MWYDSLLLLLIGVGYNVTMKINIKSVRVNLSPAFKEYVRKKINALGRFLKRFDKNDSVTAEVEIGRTTEHHRHGEIYHASVDIDLPGKKIRAEEEHSDLLAAVEIAKDKAKQDIQKHKEKTVEKYSKQVRKKKRPGK